MINKEFKESLKQAVMILSILLVVPLFYIIDRLAWNSNTDYINILIIFLGVLIYFIANRYGIEIFRPEEEDDAFEYILSLPISRMAIYFKKLIPRLIFIIPLILIYEILILLKGTINLGGWALSKFFIFHPVFFPFFVLMLMLFFSFISIFGKRNFIFLVSSASLVVTSLLGNALKELLITSATTKLNLYTINGISFLIAGLVICIIFGICFFIILRRFDVRGQRYFGNKFALYLLIPLIMLTIISFGILIFVNQQPLTVDFNDTSLNLQEPMNTIGGWVNV